MIAQPDALKIIDHWIRTAADSDKKKILFVIQDEIYDDLNYINSPDVFNRVTVFLDAGNQENEDLKTIREFIKL